MVDLLRQMLDPFQPWQRARYPRDYGYALTINLAQLVIVVLIVQAALRLIDRVF